MTYQQNIDVTAATIAAPAVTFDHAPLFAALEYINKHIVERRNTVPILANVLIEATSDGMARLIATDLDLEAVITIPADWAMPGAFSVCAATLRDIVKKARAFSGEVRLSYDNGFAIVNAGRTRQRLEATPDEGFPRLAATELPLTWECDAATLAADIALVSLAISKEERRYYLNGIFIHALGDGVLRMAATNGHIMSTVARPAPIAAMEWEGVIMPRKAVAAMAAAIKDQESAALSFSASKFRVVAGNIELYSKLIDGTFPDYARVLRNATGGAAALAVTGPELAAHCKMAVKDGTRHRPLTLNLSVNGCRAGQAGYANPLSAEYDGGDYAIAFDATYLEPLAKQLDNIIMQGAPFDDARGDVCSMLLTSPSAPHWTGCIMPLRDFAPLPAPFAPRYIETMPAPRQAADLFGAKTFDREFAILKSGPRKATSPEIEAYARDYAARLGHVDAAANWVFSIAKTNADGQVVAVEFGKLNEIDNRVTILLPGYGQDKQPVTVEIMDDAGEYAAPMACTNGKGDIAMPDQPKGRAKARAKRRASTRRVYDGKGIDPAYIAAPAPISEPATVARVSAELEPERVRTVSRIIGGLPYGYLQESHFVIGLGDAFNYCEGRIDHWYAQKEGRESVYGEGYATREGAIAEIDRIITSERDCSQPAIEAPQETPAAPEIVTMDEPATVKQDARKIYGQGINPLDYDTEKSYLTAVAGGSKWTVARWSPAKSKVYGAFFNRDQYRKLRQKWQCSQLTTEAAQQDLARRLNAPIATGALVDSQSDAIAALIARVEALESAIERQATPPSGEIADFEPLPHDPRALSIIRGKQEIAAADTLSVQSKPKRTAAHVRAVMAYLAMRKERRIFCDAADQMMKARDNLQDMLRSTAAQSRIFYDQKRDYYVNWKRDELTLQSVTSERDQYRANAEKSAADYLDMQKQRDDAQGELQRLQALNDLRVKEYCRLIDDLGTVGVKRRRAVIAARTRSQAAWQLGKALVASIDESERLKRVAYQQAGHIVNVAERLDRAETQLRKHGPALTIVPPITLAVPVAA